MQLHIRYSGMIKARPQRLHRFARTLGGYLNRYLSLRTHYADRDERLARLGYVIFLVMISLVAAAEMAFLAVLLWDVLR